MKVVFEKLFKVLCNIEICSNFIEVLLTITQYIKASLFDGESTVNEDDLDPFQF